MWVEVVLCLVVVFMLWKTLQKPPRLPPGRWGLPLVGYVPFTTKSMEEQVTEMHKKHGNIVLWRIGTQVMVFINDYKTIREAYNRPEFSDRPDWETFKLFEHPAVGVGSTSGLQWQNNRRFTLRQLRDLGMGKSKLVDAIQHQAVELTNNMEKKTGKPGPVPTDVVTAIVNIIWEMVASKQFEATDPRLQRFMGYINEFLFEASHLAIKDFYPWLEYIMPAPLFKRLIRYYSMFTMKKKFFEYFYEEIDKHKATLDPENPRDLIDSYLIEMQENEDDPDNTRSERDLAFLVFDLFFAGSETTNTTFLWTCMYLASYPDVQRKLHKEIDEVLPNGILPTLAEKTKMPYTEALINEVMRMSTLVNFGLQHKAATDAELGGYIIPKDAILCTSVFDIHFDDRHWNDAKVFRPERWLDGEGKLVMKKEGFLPFGVGKRVCPGEGLARMELLIFIAAVFQKFSIAPPPGKTINLKPNLDAMFIRKPYDNQFVFSSRKQM